MKPSLFIILNCLLIAGAVTIGLFGLLEFGVSMGCYFWGDKTVFCFAPALVPLSVAALLGGSSLFLIWRRWRRGTG